MIFRCFSKAYEALKDRMVSTAMSENITGSLLGTVIAANYQEYLDQRQRLRDVFERDPRFAQYHEPPSPPAPPTPEYVPPPPPSPPPAPPAAATTSAPSTRPSTASGTGAPSEHKEKLTKAQRRLQAARERADQLKQLRPDIEAIPDSISNEQALALGGYKDQSKMDRDLAARRRALRKQQREAGAQS